MPGIPSPILSAAELGRYTGHQDLTQHDRSGNDWLDLRESATAVAKTRLASHLDPDKVTNPEALKEWADTWCVSRILYQESSEEGDRYHEQAAILDKREPKIWDYSVRALKTDEDGDGQGERTMGRAMPRTFNVVPQSHLLNGGPFSPGTSAGQNVFWPRG